MNIDILNDDQLARLSQLIHDAQTIIVTCHTNPDGDALGSSLGWAEYLRSIGKDPVVIIPDKYPDFLRWMPNTEKMIRYDHNIDRANLLIRMADLIFCLDYNTLSRLDKMEQTVVEAKAPRVVVDHHLSPDIPADLTVSYPEASSTSELIFRIVWQLGGFEQQNRHFAVPVYCGMMTDTGGFTFNSTRPEIFFIISQLLTKGINKDKIYRNVYNNYSEDRVRLMGYVMYRKLVTDPARHASYFTLTRDEMRQFHFIKGDAEGLVNVPLQIKGLKLSISLREDSEKDNLVWVSLRSVDDFPCNKVAEEFFNGGGHLNAAGGRLNCSVAEAEEVVRQAFLRWEEELKR